MSLIDLLGTTLAASTMLGTTIGLVCQCAGLTQLGRRFPVAPPTDVALPMEALPDFDDSRLFIVAVESRFPDDMLIYAASNSDRHDRHAA